MIAVKHETFPHFICHSVSIKCSIILLYLSTQNSYTIQKTGNLDSLCHLEYVAEEFYNHFHALPNHLVEKDQRVKKHSRNANECYS